MIEANASVDYKEMVIVEGIHQINDGVSNTVVSAKLKFKF
jgi:uridine kinase